MKLPKEIDELLKCRGRFEASLLKDRIKMAKQIGIPIDLILESYEEELAILKQFKNSKIPKDLHVTEDNVFDLFYKHCF